MSVIYIREQGAFISKLGEQIVVTRNNQQLLSFPVNHIDGLACFGNVQLSTQVIAFLLERGVDITLFSRSGELTGQICGSSSKNVFLRFAQFDAYQNESRRLELARSIVSNKIENQIQLIQYHRFTDNHDFKTDVRQMRALQNRLVNCKTANELMGIEGICSRIYFSCFSHMINCSIPFNGRNRRPPRDPINVILSLGYTFLTKELCSVLESESFELYLGFLHGIRYGRKSLALDIEEEFRQPIVDRFVIRVFNKRIINEYDFEAEDDAVHLTEDGFRKFCKEFERWMISVDAGQSKTYRQLIREQSVILKKAIREGTEYIPYQWRKENAICNQL